MQVDVVRVALLALAPVERRFLRERVRDAELLEAHDAAGLLLALLELEAALPELEHAVQALEHRREHAQHEVVGPGVARELAAVHESVLLARVAVQVAEQLDLAFLLEHLQHALREVDRRVQVLARLQPAPVQVEAQQRAAVVAVHDAVGVQHRNHFEDVVLAQLGGRGVVAEQELDEALDDPGRLGFAGVHAGGDHNAFIYVYDSDVIALHFSLLLIIYFIVFLLNGVTAV